MFFFLYILTLVSSSRKETRRSKRACHSSLSLLWNYLSIQCFIVEWNLQPFSRTDLFGCRPLSFRLFLFFILYYKLIHTKSSNEPLWLATDFIGKFRFAFFPWRMKKKNEKVLLRIYTKTEMDRPISPYLISTNNCWTIELEKIFIKIIKLRCFDNKWIGKRRCWGAEWEEFAEEISTWTAAAGWIRHVDRRRRWSGRGFLLNLFFSCSTHCKAIIHWCHWRKVFSSRRRQLP